MSFKDLAELNSAVTASQSWPRKLQLIPNLVPVNSQFKAEVNITGTLTAAESDAVRILSVQPASLKSAVEAIRLQSLLPASIIESRFKDSVVADTDLLISNISKQRAQSSKAMSALSEDEEEEQALQEEALKRERQSSFVKLASPTIIQELTRTLVFGTIQDLVPEIHNDLVPLLLSEVVKVPTPNSKDYESAFTALQRLSEVRNSASPTLDAYFTPSNTDMYTMSCLEEYTEGSIPESPSLSVNGVLIPFDKITKSWAAFQMTGAQTYHLSANIPHSQLQWSTPKSMTSPFTDSMLLPVDMARNARHVMIAIKRAVLICQTCRLNADEVGYLGVPELQSQRLLAADFNNPSFDLLIRLLDYADFRDKCKPVSEANTAVGLLRWLARTTDFGKDDIINELCNCTGWNENRLREAIDAKYAAPSAEDLLGRLRSLDELLSLQEIMMVDIRLSAAAGVESQPSLYGLFSVVKARFTPSQEDEADAARNLRSRLTLSQRAASDRGLMENQRRALVAYFLQQPYADELGIRDADGIFEYFLIDAQMGPSLKTSRVKQAISVVQLFAQRTLLGLEKEVSKTSLIREQWEWRRQYSLWEAYVKMFLYPENWLDPSLRDDKSQLFEDFEQSLMKKNLSLDTFTEAIKTYVYGLNQISNLQTISYIREPQGSTDIFHLFGCTRSAPQAFYHRTLTVVRGESVGVFWRPWTKIEMDIPVVETEWEGKRLDATGSHLIPVWIGGRLYIFFPQITPKSTERRDAGASAWDGKNFGELEATPNDVAKPVRQWEIRMAWAELSRGTWTPKRVSAGSLTLEAALPKPNELRFEPKFESARTSTRVTLVAGYPVDHSFQQFGGFSFCDDQMTALPKADISFDMTKPLHTARFQQEDLAKVSDIEPGKPLAKTDEPLPYYWYPTSLAATSATPQNKSVSWTLSYSAEEGPTSFSVSARRVDETSASYFSVPKVGYTRIREWNPEQVDAYTETVAVDHSFSQQLMTAAAQRSHSLTGILDVLTNRQSAELSATFGNSRPETDPQGPTYHELAKPTALYNWEIGLHSVLMAMDRFFATQQFEEALQVARLVFDPTVDVQVGAAADQRSSKTSCWKFPPFQDVAEKVAKRHTQTIKLGDVAADKDFNLAIMERLSFGALVHATARGRPEAYMKWIVMRYAEILLAAGDVCFRRGTLESLPLAIQRYVEAFHILGPEPPKIPKLGKKRPLHWYNLFKEDVDMELGLPFSPELQRKDVARGASVQADNKIVCHLRTTYFCVPLNPKFRDLRTLVSGRLFNIRNSLDINGRPVTYALLEPPIDPSDLMALGSQGQSMSHALAAMLGGQDSPLPRQRFSFLLSQAMDLCGELRGLADRMLAAIEKREEATFTVLRAQFATGIQRRMVDIKTTALDEAEATVSALQLGRDKLVSDLEFYLALIGEPTTLIPKTSKDGWTDLRQDIDAPSKDDLRMSSYERTEMALTDAATALELVAQGMDGLVAPLFAIPDFEANAQPMGMGASVSTGGKSAAY